VEDINYQVPLPPDYDENALFLMFQSPRVLYAYWELSPGLKNLLHMKKKVQIRLNAEGYGVYHSHDIALSQKSFYFLDLEPGQSYHCEIGIVNSGDQFYPLLRSNTVTTPHDRPRQGCIAPEDRTGIFSTAFITSSWVFYPRKK